MINALKWLVHFLETRFPEKVNPVAAEEFISAMTAWDKKDKQQDTDIEVLKKQIEILNLRVGLSRPMQTVLRNKSNG